MLTSNSDSDDDKYVPSGLLNSANQTLERKDIKTNEISEFYSAVKPNNVTSEKHVSSPVLIDLSSKPSFSEEISSEKSCSAVRGRVLSIPPGPRSQVVPPSAVRAHNRLTVQRTTLPHRVIQVQHMMNPALYPPIQVPISPMIPVRSMFYPPRLHPYTPPGLVSMKMHAHPQTFNSYVQPPVLHSPKMYPSHIHPQLIHSSNAYPCIAHPTMSNSKGNHPSTLMGSSFLTSTVLPSSFSSRTMMVPHSVPVLPSLTGFPNLNQTSHIMQPMPCQEAAITLSEARKKLHEEALAKAKENRAIRRAELKAKKVAERAEARKKKMGVRKDRETINKKFVNFSKDMFVIRLKDVDSFDRNNEIWRIDNHILIQKFCGVPSLRAPARQFQSTNKMSGYDSRATWRFFIIDPEHVEIDKYGSEITIHDFPPIGILREAKKLAEGKDEEFKDIEKGEFKEKLNQFEAKQISKIMEKQKRRIEKKQKWFESKGEFSSSKNVSDGSLDEDVCRNIMNGLLDALEDEDYNEEDSLSLSEDEMSCSDEEDDAGSLITLAHSTDSEEDDHRLFHEVEIPLQLFGEHELPEVALELTVD